MDKKDTKTTKPKTHHRPLIRKKVFDVMPPGRASASPTSRPVVASRKPPVKDSVLKQDVPSPISVPVSAPTPVPKPAARKPQPEAPAVSPAISNHRQSPIRPATAPVLGSLRATHHPRLGSLQPATPKDPNARSQLATAAAPTIVPHTPDAPMQNIGGGTPITPTAPSTAPELQSVRVEPRVSTANAPAPKQPEHREEDMEGLERLALDQVIEVSDPDVKATLEDGQDAGRQDSYLTSILENPDLANKPDPDPQPEISQTGDKPDQPPVARPEPLLFEPRYKKKERRGHAVQIIVIIVMLLLLAALVLNFLLDAESIKLPVDLPHTDII